ncbi:hypothetical protein K8I85_07980, partial [bacterium]|nr:hypothetical protein [bacterium]
TGAAGFEAATRSHLDAHLAVPSPLVIAASTSLGPGAATVTIDVSIAPGEMLPGDPSTYTVRAILYEEEVTYCCDTLGGDTFRHIGRAISDGQPLVPVVPGGRTSQVETLPLDPSWGADLRAVVFVTDAAGAVVQSAPATDGTSAVSELGWGRLKALYR